MATCPFTNQTCEVATRIVLPKLPKVQVCIACGLQKVADELSRR